MEGNKNLFKELGLEPKSGELTPQQIMKVKGLGCLRDKRYPDVFNIRVITRNGKITTDEGRAIAKAADLYGSGEFAMTSRMTIEIQGVKYDNIPSLIFFLKEISFFFNRLRYCNKLKLVGISVQIFSIALTSVAAAYKYQL